jgi:hypothetical protein
MTNRTLLTPLPLEHWSKGGIEVGKRHDVVHCLTLTLTVAVVHMLGKTDHHLALGQQRQQGRIG